MPWDSFGFVLWQYPDYLDFHFACNCTTDAAISTPNTTSVSLPPPGDECFASCHLEILHIQYSDAHIFNVILVIVDYLLVLPNCQMWYLCSYIMSWNNVSSYRDSLFVSVDTFNKLRRPICKTSHIRILEVVWTWLIVLHEAINFDIPLFWYERPIIPRIFRNFGITFRMRGHLSREL